MVKRIIASLIVFAVAAVGALAMTKPNYNYEYAIDDPSDRVVAVLTAADIDAMNECHIEDGNKIVVVGNTFPHILFADVNEEFGSAVVNIGENDKDISVFFNAEGKEGYNNEYSDCTAVLSGDKDCVFPNYVDSAKNIRMGSGSNFTFVSLELHTASATLVKVEPPVNPVRIGGCVLAAMICALAVFVLDIKFGFIEIIFEKIKGVYKTWIKLALTLVGCSAVAAVAEYIIYRTQLKELSYVSFNPYRMVLILGVLFIIAVPIIFRKSIGERPENAFLCISLALCIMFIVISPFGHTSWDDNTHYKWTLNASYFGLKSYISEADEDYFHVEDNIRISSDYYINVSRIIRANEDYEGITYIQSGTETVAHVPDGIVMALARYAGMSYYEIVTLSKLGSAFVFCVVCYLAMRRLKSGKMILAVVAMFPLNLFLASNFSYDYWVNCFTVLGMAYFVGNLQQKDEPISIKDTLIMCGSFAVAALPKLVYALMLVIPFFMKPKKIDKKKAYYSVCVLSILALVALLAFKTVIQMGRGGDTRGGEDVNTMGQISYILGNPVGFIKMMMRFLVGYLHPRETGGYTVFFAYIGGGKGKYAILALMALTTLTDRNEYDVKAYSWLTRLMAAGVYLGMAIVVATALYIEFTPVGADTVEGCQLRYLIPMIYPLLSVIGYVGIKNKIPAGLYNTAIMMTMAGISVYNIATLFLPYVS